MDTTKENEYIFNEIDELRHFVNLRAKNAHQTVDQYILDMFDKDPGALDGAFEKPYANISKEAQSQRRSVLETALKGF